MAWVILLACVARNVAGRRCCSSPHFDGLLSEDELVGVRTWLVLSFPPPLNLLIRHGRTPSLRQRGSRFPWPPDGSPRFPWHRGPSGQSPRSRRNRPFGKRGSSRWATRIERVRQ